MYERLGATKWALLEQGIIFFLWRRERKSSIGNRFFINHRKISTVKRVAFISDMMSCKVLRVRWCNSIVFNVHAPIEENVKIQKAVFMRNWSKFSIIFLSTT